MFTNVNDRKKKVKERKVLGDKTNIIFEKAKVVKPKLLVVIGDSCKIVTRKAIENNLSIVSRKNPEIVSQRVKKPHKIKNLHNKTAYLDISKSTIKERFDTDILNNKHAQGLKNINTVSEENSCNGDEIKSKTGYSSNVKSNLEGPMKQLKVVLECDKNVKVLKKTEETTETDKNLLNKAGNVKPKRKQPKSKEKREQNDHDMEKAEGKTEIPPQSSSKAGKGGPHRKLTVVLSNSGEIPNFEAEGQQKACISRSNTTDKALGHQIAESVLTVLIDRSQKCVIMDKPVTSDDRKQRTQSRKAKGQNNVAVPSNIESECQLNVNETSKETPKSQLSVMLEKSPIHSPEFLGFSEENFDDFSKTLASHISNSVSLNYPLELLSTNQNIETNCPSLSLTPRSCRMVQEGTPRTLKIILERINPQSTSPDFLDFVNSDKPTISTLNFTPKTLKIILSKMKSTDLNIQQTHSKGDSNLNVIGNNNNKKITSNIKNRVLQVSLTKNLRGRKLITQLDGITHSSEISLDNETLEKPKEGENLLLQVSPSFEGFEKEESGSPNLLHVLENSVQELEEYISMLAEESLERIEKVAGHIEVHKGMNEATIKHKTYKVTRHNNQTQNTVTNKVKLLKSIKTKSNKVSSKKQGLTINTLRHDKTNKSANTVNSKSDIIEINKAQKTKTDAGTAKVGQEFQTVQEPLSLESMFKGFEPHEQSLPVQKVTFNLPQIEESLTENHVKLRKIPEINYCEDSVMDGSIKLINPIESQKKVPIYKQIVPENKPIKSNDDEYEFTDISPKKTIKKNLLKRSSGFFDKETHLVVKKLEKKEQLKKKRQIKKATKKKVIANPEKSVTYKKTVDSIVSNVLKKVNQRKSSSPIKNITDNLKNNVVFLKGIKEKASVKANVENSNNIEVVAKQNAKENNQVYSIDIGNEPQNNKIVVEAVVHTNDNMPQTVPHSSKEIQENKNDMVTSRRPQREVVTQLQDKSKIEVVPDQPQLYKEILENRNDMVTSRRPHREVVTQLEEKMNNIEVVPEQPNVPDKTLDVINKSLNITTPNINGDISDIMPDISVPDQSVLNETYNVQQVTYNDASIIQNDIDTCFGFEGLQEVHDIQAIPQVSTPIVSKVNVISNVTLHQRNVESPVNFQRPNANSTMLGCNFGLQKDNFRMTGSPWRLELKTLRQNPYFISVKNNTLPRLDQEMVLDHTLVEQFESHCSKNSSKLDDSKKSPVQQSILSYIECDADIVEKENLTNQRPSLFDYEAFNSPVKITRRNDRLKNVKRKILGDSGEDNIIINNDVASVVDFNEENEENTSYFGFDENSPVIAKTKNLDAEKAPSRFDPNLLKKYKSRKKRLQEKQVKFTPAPVEDIPSVSILNVTNEDGNQDGTDEMHLFTDAEELFDDKPVEIRLKRTKRCRTVSVDDDDETEKKVKKHKKTKFEIEQENWIKSFNKELEEVENFELETV